MVVSLHHSSSNVNISPADETNPYFREGPSFIKLHQSGPISCTSSGKVLSLIPVKEEKQVLIEEKQESRSLSRKQEWNTH